MKMTFQALDGHSARSDELHRHILRSHLAYLNQEETPAKLQQRHNLESLISEFLCMVSHGSKFTFYEITKILNDSIENNANFSAYKAGTAFEALEKYATNLINHPWRKEYKTVKLYSGFYKHSVESQLLGGSAVFRLLGYQFADDGVLYLDEPIDPDKVARVALDCLIAYVECQIMLQICERIKSYKCSWLEINQVRQDYMCSIDEVVRILHQLKRNTSEQEKQDRWLREQENGALSDSKSFSKSESGSSYQTTGILVDVSNTWPSSSTYSEYSSNGLILQPTIASGSYTTKSHKNSELLHPKLPSWSEGVSSQKRDCQSRNFISKSNDEMDGFVSHSLDDHNPPNYSFPSKSHNSDARYTNSDLTPETWNDTWDFLRPSVHHNSSYLDNDLDGHHRTSYSNPVPNVKETYSSHFGNMYPPHPVGHNAFPFYPHDFSLHSRQCQCQMCSDLQTPILPHKYYGGNDLESRRQSTRVETNHADSTGEICSSLLKMSVEPPNKTRHFPVTTAHTYQTNTSSGDVTLRTNSANKSQQNASVKRGSYYDNVPSPFEDKVISSFNAVGQSLNPKCDFQSNGALPLTSTALSTSKPRNQKGVVVSDSVVGTLSSKPIAKKTYSNSSTSSVTEHLQGVTLVNNSDAKSSKSVSAGTQKDAKGGKKWSCSSCTFYNASEKSICDMCGRSKNPGPEIAPLVSGGRECPQCTLVNKKDCEDCTACGASLKDSPTYI